MHSRWRGQSATLLLVLAFLAGQFAPLSTAGSFGNVDPAHAQSNDVVDRPLRELASRQVSGSVRVIVQAEDAEKARVALRAHALAVHHERLPSVQAAAGEIPLSSVDALSRAPGVRRVAIDPRVWLGSTEQEDTRRSAPVVERVALPTEEGPSQASPTAIAADLPTALPTLTPPPNSPTPIPQPSATQTPAVAGVTAAESPPSTATLPSTGTLTPTVVPTSATPTSLVPALPPSVFVESTGAAALHARGLTGRGVSIAIIDSGVQSHSSLGTPSRVIANVRINNGAAGASDQYGHGTWVSGITAGDGRSDGSNYLGMAPAATLVNLKVSDDEGRAYVSDIIRALGWAVEYRALYNIRVLNLSLVSSQPESYSSSLLAAAAEIAWHAGIVVIASAGNDSSQPIHAAPANDPFVITVGALDDSGTVLPGDDLVASFSAPGPTTDGLPKPDLLAPGRHVVGPLARANAGLARLFPDRTLDNRYIQLSGTSASAPVVAGGVALLLEARPHLSPNQVKWLLVSTSRQLPDSSGRVLDVLAAVNYDGEVGLANHGTPPNRLVAATFLQLGGTIDGLTSWDSVSWDSVSWDSVSWDSVSWDSVSWDSVSWDSVSWDSVSWDSALIEQGDGD